MMNSGILRILNLFQKSIFLWKTNNLVLATLFFTFGCGKVVEDKYRPAAKRILELEVTDETESIEYADFFSEHKNKQLTLITLQDSPISPTVLARIKNEFDIVVRIEVASSFQDLLLRLSSDSPHDIVYLDLTDINYLISNAKLIELDWENVPNLKKVSRNGLINQIGNLLAENEFKYHSPYSWTTIGIAYNMDAFPSETLSWDTFYSSRTIESISAFDLQDRISTIDNMRIALGAALITQGLSPNSQEDNALNSIRDLMMNHIDYLAEFNDTQTNSGLLAGDYLLAVETSSQATKYKIQNPKIAFQTPEQGSIVLIQSLAALKKSKQPELAKRMINYLLEPNVAGLNSNHSKQASVLKQAKTHTDRELITGPAYYFPEPANNAHVLEPLSESVLANYISLWQEVKTAFVERKNGSSKETTFKSSLAVSASAPVVSRVRSPIDICLSVLNDGELVSTATSLEITLPEGIELLNSPIPPIINGKSLKWNLGSIIAGRFKKVCFTIAGFEISEYNLEVEVDNSIGSPVSIRFLTEIIGIPAVDFEVIDSDPVDVGHVTNYKVVLSNKGTGLDTNVKLICEVNDLQKIITASGPTNYFIDENTIVFEPIEKLESQQIREYSIQVEAISKGTGIFKGILSTDYKPNSIIVVEPTTQY